MFFSIKSKAINVDLFTADPNAFYNAKPASSAHFWPDWWKKLPDHLLQGDSKILTSPTMRSCAGFIDLYKNGWMIPMWSDLRFETDSTGDYIWQYADKKSEVSSHNIKQAGSLLDGKNMLNAKLMTPWQAKSKESVKTVMMSAMWNHGFTDDWVIPPAVTDPYYTASLNINMFVTKTNTSRVFEIPFLTPLVQMIPITERPVKLHTHLIDKQEYDRILDNDSQRPTFLRSHFVVKKIKDLANKDHG